MLSESAPLPFPIDERAGGEDVRLRTATSTCAARARPGRCGCAAGRTRSPATCSSDRDFLEIETPTLTRSTPEGARDFLVPARLRPGSWYALPQSPQLFKQLLMVSGLERYFQIARCYRDEDFRADRQPEFTQLDIETSFVEQDDVIALGEAIVAALWSELVGHEITTPIPRITYAEAMARYGSDKPDLRFGIELTELTEYFADTPFRVFQDPYVGAVVMPGGALAAAPDLRRLAGVGQAARRPRAGLRAGRRGRHGRQGGPVAKNLSDAEREGLREGRRGEPRRLHLLRRRRGRPGPGAARRRPRRDRRAGSARSTRAPGRSCGSSTPRCSRRPTRPPPPATSRSAAAVDGGAPRVHLADPGVDRHVRVRPRQRAGLRLRPRLQRQRDRRGVHPYPPRDVQERVFALMGLAAEEQQEKFGFLLDAFAFGPPPHGGIAFGWDRICALLAGVDSIREVIAFPKTGGGFDPLTAAPAPITALQRKEAGVDAKPAAAPAPEPAAAGPAAGEPGEAAGPPGGRPGTSPASS